MTMKVSLVHIVPMQDEAFVASFNKFLYSCAEGFRWLPKPGDRHIFCTQKFSTIESMHLFM